MKKSKIIIIASIVVAAVLVKTKTNLWMTEIRYFIGAKEEEYPWRFFRLHGTAIEYHEDGSKYSETPYVKG
jgi:hypothetical protein